VERYAVGAALRFGFGLGQARIPAGRPWRATAAGSGIASDVGVVIDAALPDRWDAALFGEGQSRIVVSLPASSLDALAEVCRQERAPWVELGGVGGDTLHVGKLGQVDVERLRDPWSGGLERALASGA
jgi:phosphoribosylformylglycinamidine (FGAM) synthase-like enzyme